MKKLSGKCNLANQNEKSPGLSRGIFYELMILIILLPIAPGYEYQYLK